MRCLTLLWIWLMRRRIDWFNVLISCLTGDNFLQFVLLCVGNPLWARLEQRGQNYVRCVNPTKLPPLGHVN